MPAKILNRYIFLWKRNQYKLSEDALSDLAFQRELTGSSSTVKCLMMGASRTIL